MGNSGLVYFPLDCHMNDKVKLIQAEFGLVGYAVVIKLWQKIYSDKGYYTEWGRDVALLFSQENGVGGNVVQEVVRACLKRGIFDQGLFEEHGILTSDGIQRRYAEGTARRTSVKIDRRYLLITAPKNWVLGDENLKNADNCGENADGFAQSKVKKNKEKYYPPISPPQGETDGLFEEFWSAYPKKVGRAQARESFGRIAPDRAVLDKMLSAIAEQRESDQWRREAGRFIPNPSNWLERGQWMDEVNIKEKEEHGGSFDTDSFFEAAVAKSLYQEKV